MVDPSPQHYSFDRVARMAVSVVTLAVVLALLRYLSDVLIPFAAAAVLAYLLNPLVGVFEERTRRRGLAVALTIGGLGIVGLSVIAILTPLMLAQFGRFQGDLSRLRGDITASLEWAGAAEDESAADETERLSDDRTDSAPRAADGETRRDEGDGAERSAEAKSMFGLSELSRGWEVFRRNADKPGGQRFALLYEQVKGTPVGDLIDRTRRYLGSEEFDRFLLDTARRLAVGGWSVVAFTLNLILGLTGLIVVLLYLVFLLLDYPHYAGTWQTFLPPAYREPVVDFLRQFDAVLRRYLRGQSVVALSVGALFALGFTLIGLPMALPFGLFIGLLNMVPYLQTVALVPAMLLAGLRAIDGDASVMGSVGLTLLIFAVVQVIQDTLLTPRIMGQATGLKPVAILLGVFIWGKLLGFLGLLLAIPLTCLGIAYYRRFVLLHGSEVED